MLIESAALAVALLLVAPPSKADAGSREPNPKVVRCAVIGGMTMTGLWDEIASRFEKRSGLRVDVVATGPRPLLDQVFRAGEADLLTMHSGDITTDLAADGLAANLRAWTRNELVIVGPPGDPARIAGLNDGAAALRRIAETKNKFVDFEGIGSREVTHHLWRKAGLKPQGEWLLKDESRDGLEVLAFAEQHNAYVIVGRMPVIFEKMEVGGMRIVVEGDPAMRRPYVVLEADSQAFPQANHAGARALADFLLSDEIQGFLATFGQAEHGGNPLFLPVRNVVEHATH